MSSANSIIRYYQTESPANSSHDLPCSALTHTGAPETLESTAKSISSSLTFPKIDRLPTPLKSAKSGFSFITLPLRLFRAKKKLDDKSENGNQEFGTAELKEESAYIDVISNSPVELQLPVAVDVESDIYDEFIRCVSHGEKNAGNNDDEVNDVNAQYDTQDYLHIQEPELNEDSETVVGSDEAIELIHSAPRQTSTLNRMKDTTKSFLRFISIHPDNNKLEQYCIPSAHFHGGNLKRRFSIAGSRSNSWKRFKASTSERGKPMQDLFQSEDFERRLREGDVSSRRESFEQDDNYHIDFKVNMDNFKPPVLTPQKPNSLRAFHQKSINRLKNSLLIRLDRPIDGSEN